MTAIFFAIGFLICGKIVLSIYRKKWNDNLAATVQFVETALSEGDTGHIREMITNKKSLPVPVMTVRFELDKSIHYETTHNISVSDRQYRTDVVSLMPHKQLERSFGVSFTKRGFYKVDLVEISTSDVFSAQKLAKHFDNSTEIYIYPAHSRYTDILAPFSRVNGEALRNRFMYEDPFEFKGLLDYTGTEPMKKINWRATAKAGELKVNSYYDTASRHITIILDIVNDQIWRNDDQVEECIRIARNYLEGFIRNKVPVKIISNAKSAIDGRLIDFLGGTDSAYVESCLKKMALIDLNVPTERLYSYLNENQADQDELAVLLSVDITDNMARAYESYLGRSYGEWIAPVASERDKRIVSGKFNITYLEVGR